MLEKIFTEDLTSKDTFFYPCSGIDVEIISDLLKKNRFFPLCR